MMDYRRTDAILRNMLDDRNTIIDFFDAIFSFLSRNTDFYHIQTSENEIMGFPRGMKEQIVMHCMQRYDPQWLSQQIITDDITAPVAVEEVEVECSKIDESNHHPIINHDDNITTEFNDSDHKNGAIFNNYCWSQTIGDVELHIKLPDGVTSGKELNIELKPNSITVKCLEEITLISGDTWSKYKCNDVIWTIAERKLHITFDKTQQSWWEKLFCTEPSIDIKKIEVGRYIDELPEETQTAIENIHYKQLEKHEKQILRLQEAWNLDGSPFKGQPFDPSQINFL